MYEVPEDNTKSANDFVVLNGLPREGARADSSLHSLGVFIRPTDTKDKRYRNSCLGSSTAVLVSNWISSSVPP